MKTYVGKRTHDGCDVQVDGRPLDLRLDLRNHSPTGFNWGYGGSGPAQLALAILADSLGDQFAEEAYQDFKCQVITSLDYWEWRLTEADVRQWFDNTLTA